MMTFPIKDADLTERIYKIGRVVIWLLAGLAMAWIVVGGAR
jgi:hypothetical protein